jgi:hypothetical protein
MYTGGSPMKASASADRRGASCWIAVPSTDASENWLGPRNCPVGSHVAKKLTSSSVGEATRSPAVAGLAKEISLTATGVLVVGSSASPNSPIRHW